MSCKRLPLVIAAIAMLAGCTTAGHEVGQTDAFLGEAVKYNPAVQTINPDPVYGPGTAKPGDNGEKGAAAVERYRTDQVNDRHRKEVKSSAGGELSTTEGTSPK